jgi:hypothetical protein
MWSKLPKALKEDLDEECLSLAIDIDDLHAVIEITGCVNGKTGKVDRAVQRIIDRAESYAEQMPHHDGIRIIGRTYGGSPIDLGCCAESPDWSEMTISIYRNCDRWVPISGLPIVNKRFENLDKLIDELMARMEDRLYLN